MRADRQRELGLTRLVAQLRWAISMILRSECVSGELRYLDRGVSLVGGGVWSATVWKPDGVHMEVICRQGTDERWLVMLRPTRQEWVPVVLEWPRENVEAELRRAIEALRLTVDQIDDVVQSGRSAHGTRIG
jgi:hypothetical protein